MLLVWMPVLRKRSAVLQWLLGLKPGTTTQLTPREACYVKRQYACGDAIADLSNDKGNKPVGTAVKVMQLFLISHSSGLLSLIWCLAVPCINQWKINCFNCTYHTAGFVSTSSASTAFLFLPSLKLAPFIEFPQYIYIDTWRDIWVLIAADFFEGGTE